MITRDRQPSPAISSNETAAGELTSACLSVGDGPAPGKSPEYNSRTCEQQTLSAIMDVVMDIPIQEVERLLKDNDYSVSAIAQETCSTVQILNRSLSLRAAALEARFRFLAAKPLAAAPAPQDKHAS